ncbi:hypothetical protein [Stutzerimonas stutzeri]|uniref:hypothetical protein n=1 Tax=Stutzerimonas stutzeri TaxID=316 RepID=UPI0020B2C636|nr:hypothetical protein [Stutzerimonas stutzeri]MCP3432390.1 hypothetical protein [Stutzerimonas stutzeri]
MRVLVWGFYNQGNLGDDLMALIFAELIEELGHTAIIFSENSRFAELGYETASEFEGIKADAIVLGGGAFFKAANSSKSSIETSIGALADYIEDTAIPVFGMSLGSDGANSIDEISSNRRRVVGAASFSGAAVRLVKDVNLMAGKLSYLPDIVFAAKYYWVKKSATGEGDEGVGRILLNFSRRSIFSAPFAILRSGRNEKVTFLAHGGENPTGGELSLPLLKKYVADDILKSVDYIGKSEGIFSSKLHPGIISLSYGKAFYAAAMRAKTRDFIMEYSGRGIINVEKRVGYVNVSFRKNFDWQAELWGRYSELMNSFLQSVSRK